MQKRVGKRKGTGRDHAYGRLREDILALRLPPGTRIDEGALVRALRISRTPVREALIRLAGEGLVELLPNHGARVADIPLMSLPEFFEALSLAQRWIARWAALRRTPADILHREAEHRRFARVARATPEGIPAANRAFHAAIATAARNAFLAQSYGELLDQGLRLSRFTVLHDPPRGSTRRRHFEAVVADHEALLDAIRRGDAATAERHAAEHATLFRRRVLDFLAAADGAATIQVEPRDQAARAAKRAARKAGTSTGARRTRGATSSSR
ncbi:MAG: GntR family transcriptional regulator [Alphaproteobacteria bacterium]